jgi:hypothetical protein
LRKKSQMTLGEVLSSRRILRIANFSPHIYRLPCAVPSRSSRKQAMQGRLQSSRGSCLTSIQTQKSCPW